MGRTTIHSRICERDSAAGAQARNLGTGQDTWSHMGPMGHGGALRRPHAGLMSFQAANQMGRTQIVKILTWKSPELLLDHGSAKVTQVIVLEVFATSKVRRPFFTLGIVSSIACDIGSNLGDPAIHCSCSPLLPC